MPGCIIPRALRFHFLGGFGFRDGTHHQVYWTRIPSWDSPLKFCDSVGLVSVWQWKSSKESITDLLKRMERYCKFESIFFPLIRWRWEVDNTSNILPETCMALQSSRSKELRNAVLWHGLQTQSCNLNQQIFRQGLGCGPIKSPQK